MSDWGDLQSYIEDNPLSDEELQHNRMLQGIYKDERAKFRKTAMTKTFIELYGGKF